MLNRLAVGAKLTLMLGIALTGLLVLAGRELYGAVQASNHAVMLGGLTSVSVAINEFVHESQKERGRTGVFVGSRGAKFRQELAGQRRSTDTRRAALATALEQISEAQRGDRFGPALERALHRHLAKLDGHRRAVDALAVSGAEGIGFYTAMNAAFIGANEQIVALSPDADLSRLLTAYASLSNAKERTGVERAVLSNTFARNNFENAGEFEKFLRVSVEQDTYARAFQAQAPDAARAFYEKTVRGTVVDEAGRLRGIALASAQSSAIGVDPTHWFDTITAKIDLLKQVEDEVAKMAIAVARARVAEARSQLVFTGVLAAAIFAVTALLGWRVTRGITLPLGRMVGVLDAVSRQDLSRKVRAESRDEIGRMADALNRAVAAMRAALIEARGAASTVATASVQLRGSGEQISTGAQEQASSLRRRRRASRRSHRR